MADASSGPSASPKGDGGSAHVEDAGTNGCERSDWVMDHVAWPEFLHPCANPGADPVACSVTKPGGLTLCHPASFTLTRGMSNMMSLSDGQGHLVSFTSIYAQGNSHASTLCQVSNMPCGFTGCTTEYTAVGGWPAALMQWLDARPQPGCFMCGPLEGPPYEVSIESSIAVDDVFIIVKTTALTAYAPDKVTSLPPPDVDPALFAELVEMTRSLRFDMQEDPGALTKDLEQLRGRTGCGR